jgi:hypothetical protein
VSIASLTVSSGATWTDMSVGISTTSGNNSTGLTVGDNQVYGIWASSSSTPTAVPMSIPSYRMSLSGNTTVYYKMKATYTGGPPSLNGRISARRVR